MSGIHKPYRLLLTFACCLLMTLENVGRSNEDHAGGFVPLFNGKDLSGWQTTGTWSYEPGGILAATPQGRRRLFPDPELFLWSEAEYGDFILNLEFKLDANASSGVFLRSSGPGSYLQVQIRDSHGNRPPFGNSTCGAVVGVAAPTKNPAKPAGQWNRMTIACQGNQLHVHLNGEEVINLDLTESEKTKGLSSGHIGFENTNSPVAFRNVVIKTFTPK